MKINHVHAWHEDNRSPFISDILAIQLMYPKRRDCLYIKDSQNL